MNSIATEVENPKVVSEADWLTARKKLLAKEKEFTRLRDELSRQRRELPWEKIRTNYVFDGSSGKEPLASLFDGRHQLIVYHFMLGPGWPQGCPSCSYIADHFDGLTIHLANRDTTLVVVSHAPIAEIEAFKKRMGWKFKWVSSFGNDFNYDYHVSFTKEEIGTGSVYYNYSHGKFPGEEAPGASVFFKEDDGNIFHTYSTYGRGLDILLGAYNFLDLTPKGRDEADMHPHAMAWVRHHDRYSQTYFADQKDQLASIKTLSGACCSGENHS